MSETLPPKPSRDEFTPKLVTALREGYSFEGLRRDAIAGLTVAIVALPLSMAIAIASHASPEKGLYTAIVAGFIISVLGGSRVQIGGPTGAFVVIVYGIVQKYGLEGLTVATVMAGVILIAMGLARLGAIIKFIPQPLITGKPYCKNSRQFAASSPTSAWRFAGRRAVLLRMNRVTCQKPKRPNTNWPRHASPTRMTPSGFVKTTFNH